ncbi:ester cyclase [Pseudomonas brassicacearum]|uniref:ester cyclase n=1 Tax=Pseudomonas brassicacearum TaxID=930166 RepID=UPI00042EA900|nr:ester cyclase [Pseudomonas brassicacearum]AHL33304.1 ester cyclase [Pseudomonas brassicacearum]
MSLSSLAMPGGLRLAGFLLTLSLSLGAAAAPDALVQPQSLVVDRSLSEQQAASMILAARRYDTFWHTGDEALAREALAPNFIDKTPPAGRKQGPEGPLLASRALRSAVPDLSCVVEQMLVAGDRVVVHLRFRGHFTGTFDQRKGAGQAVEFIATDIYQVEQGKIVANWHIEDNLTLFKQLGVL